MIDDMKTLAEKTIVEIQKEFRVVTVGFGAVEKFLIIFDQYIVGSIIVEEHLIRAYEGDYEEELWSKCSWKIPDFVLSSFEENPLCQKAIRKIAKRIKKRWGIMPIDYEIYDG